jgi:hypothetical protein
MTSFGSYYMLFEYLATIFEISFCLADVSKHQAHIVFSFME